jgi:hypothetical protein
MMIRREIEWMDVALLDVVAGAQKMAGVEMADRNSLQTLQGQRIKE